MCLWTNKSRRTVLDDAEDFGNEPSGGPLKMWLAGVGVALVPLVYGVNCLSTGHTILLGEHHSNLELDGPAARALAIAYISLGAFIHFHYFWGLHPRLCGLSQLFKLLSLMLFLGSFGYTIYKIFA